METQLREQINLVVEARQVAQEATAQKAEAYQSWVEANQQILDNEANAKTVCQEAEANLREAALRVYAEVGEKTVAPGIGIRVMTRLEYEDSKAMFWALEHKLALKLDTPAFDKMVKANPLSFDFVAISEEPQATIATELQAL